jgi:pyrroline-5-carboxylate reductase
MALNKILLVGAGNMGRALVQGWVNTGIPAESILVVEPGQTARDALGSAVTSVAAIGDIQTDRFDAVVFAVKPQAMSDLLGSYRRFGTAQTVFISIAAGLSLGFLAEHLDPEWALVRAMPNTPAAIGRGMTVLCANLNTRATQRRIAEALLGSVGEVAWIEDEQLMDAVTAVSGSGPAYVFLLVESLVAAGIHAGLPADLALQLARATVAGAGELALTSSQSPGELRQQVTSKGGTTEAALAILRQGAQFETLIDQAVAAARARSEELRSG